MIEIRNIQESDNPFLASIIRNALAEFGANKPGTVYYDPTTDDLFSLFQTTKSNYNVAIVNGEIAGGGGIFPTEGLGDDTCELVKMYLSPPSRGLGLGKLLIEKCLENAKQFGFSKVYLESMPELKKALSIYEKFGFNYLCAPLGNSGHTGCNLWMMKEL
jgi:putative acetyltransferase